MKFSAATFSISAASSSDFPKGNLPEVAFVGRSNVGKSSLINALVGASSLARTSNAPGRTRLVNWFSVQSPVGEISFVDLPGFGFAKVPRAIRDTWQPMVEAYLERENIKVIVLLVDIRRGPAEEETNLLSWFNERKVKTLLVLTKVDKLAKAKRKPAVAKMTAKMPQKPDRTPVLCSTLTGDGLPELRTAIGSFL